MAGQARSAGANRRHVAAATIGNALEFYDFMTYAFFSIQIGHAFFPAQNAYSSLMLSLATFGAGFVTRPLGALLIGNYADRVGRRPAMILSFVLIGCSITAMALIPPYARIGLAAPVLAVVARMVQGFSLGGEIGSNTAFLVEAAHPGRRGFIVSWQNSSQNVALIAASAVGALLSSALSPAALDAYGWRVAFLIGAAAVPFGLWLRVSLPETLHAAEAGPVSSAAHPASAEQTRGAQARSHWRIIGLGLAVIASGTIANYSLVYIVSFAQATLHMPARTAFIAETAGYTIGIPAGLLGGWLSDRTGRRPVNVIGNLVFLLSIYPVFAWIVAERSAVALVCGVLILDITSNIIWGSFYAALAESLPKAIRGSGFGMIYSLAVALFGGTTQLVITWLIHVTGDALSPAWYMTGAACIGQAALMLMRESAPRRMAARANEA